MRRAIEAIRPAYIGLGSNLGEPITQVAEAVKRLGELPVSTVVAQSSLYRSSPFGPVEQPDFVNAVVMLETSLAATELLQRLQRIEKDLGRCRDSKRWGPRLIDLDLLILGDETVSHDGLTVPHPGIAERNFVLLPLREIAPQLIIPGLGPLADIVVNEQQPRIERLQ